MGKQDGQSGRAERVADVTPWLINRADAPRYPTMRLFRQRERGLWTDPLSELLTALNVRRTGQKDAGSQSFLDHRAILRPRPRR